MIVEDEAIVALDLQMMVEDMGYEVVGPCASVREGMSMVKQAPDMAVLDVRLTDGEVFPLADVLRNRNVKLIFHSGHVDISDIDDNYPGSAFCPKPTTEAQLQKCIRELSKTPISSSTPASRSLERCRARRCRCVPPQSRCRGKGGRAGALRSARSRCR